MHLSREGQPMTQASSELDIEAALQHPRSFFPEPKDVVAHPTLSRDTKLAILREWELDARRLSASEGEGSSIRILMSCRPNFQHVRSRARSHGPDPRPAILTITRASWLPSKMTCAKKRWRRR